MQSKQFKLSPVDTSMLTWKISIFSSHHLTDFESAFMTLLFNNKTNVENVNIRKHYRVCYCQSKWTTNVTHRKWFAVIKKDIVYNFINFKKIKIVAELLKN